MVTNNFRYSLNLPIPDHPETKLLETPLENFLHKTSAGHCEYFATATLLLLRTVGIPARYTVGYVVSDLEQIYLERHAHAYVEGQWQEVDTTPLDRAESARQSIYDWLQFYKWRERQNGFPHGWVWLLLPLSMILGWQIYLHQKQTPIHDSPATQSPFYQIIQHLIATGYNRLPGETLMAWLNRVHLPKKAKIPMMVNLHLRYHFDPKGPSPQEQTTLTNLVKTWLNHFT